jgi:IMP dehydrogenase
MAGNATAFFERAHEDEFTYFGYEDIQLRTERLSDIDAKNVSIESQITTHYRLRNPVLGTAMSSISEDAMAIAMGKAGGGAIIHHANTPEEQKDIIQEVWHWLNGIIEDPITANEDETIAQVLVRLDELGKGKRFRTIPVVDSEKRCVGLMDDTTFRLFDYPTKIKDAMHPFEKLDVAEAGISPADAYQIMRSDKLGVLTLLDKSRKIGGLCLAKDIMRTVRSDPHEFSLTEQGKLITFASVPTIPEEALERIKLMERYLNVVAIDSSHGESKYALDTLKAIKENYPNIDVIAANISTYQAAQEVAKLHPDAMTAGQGPGGICISSDRLGFGTPQASAVYEVAKAAREVDPNISVIADGGIKDSADTMKAFALGATAVKVGGLVAGTDETPVPVLRDEEGNFYREYWGMGSLKAQRDMDEARRRAAQARYNHYDTTDKVIFAEGFVKRVPLKGPVKDVIEEHVKGVKISMAAQGAADIKDLRDNAVFMRGSNRKS